MTERINPEAGKTGLPRARWRKSSYSNAQSNCVEVAVTGSLVSIRDSKDPDGGVLKVGPEAWRALTAYITNTCSPSKGVDL